MSRINAPKSEWNTACTCSIKTPIQYCLCTHGYSTDHLCCEKLKASLNKVSDAQHFGTCVGPHNTPLSKCSLHWHSAMLRNHLLPYFPQAANDARVYQANSHVCLMYDVIMLPFLGDPVSNTFTYCDNAICTYS